MPSFGLLTPLQVLAPVSAINLHSQVVVKFFSCIDGNTTCVQGAIATCVNGQFDTSNGHCPATQECFALPSVNSSGTVSQAGLMSRKS